MYRWSLSNVGDRSGGVARREQDGIASERPEVLGYAYTARPSASGDDGTIQIGWHRYGFGAAHSHGRGASKGY